MTTTMTISTSLVWLPVYGYMENKVNEWMNELMNECTYSPENKGYWMPFMSCF
jgi:hypothetical protein